MTASTQGSGEQTIGSARLRELQVERQQADSIYDNLRAEGADSEAMLLVERLYDLSRNALQAILDGEDPGLTASLATAGALGADSVQERMGQWSPSASPATLTIPEKYAPMMRIAALREMEDDARGLKGQANKTIEAIRKNEFLSRHKVEEAEDLDWLMSDVLGSARNALPTIAVTIQVCEGKEQIEGPAEALAYMLDSLWRRVISEELSDMAGPLDGDDEPHEVSALIEAMEWAKSEVERLRADWRREFETKRKLAGEAV